MKLPEEIIDEHLSKNRLAANGRSISTALGAEGYAIVAGYFLNPPLSGNNVDFHPAKMASKSHTQGDR